MPPRKSRICNWCNRTFSAAYSVTRHQEGNACPNKPEEKKVIEFVSQDEDVLSEKGKIVLNGISIPCRESDGFVLLTELARAGEHRLDNYLKSKTTQMFLASIHKLPVFQGRQLLITEEGRHGGTWGHRLIAYNYAQYISGEFAARVCVWLDELFQTGKVAIEDEKSMDELEKSWKNKYSELEKKHEALYKPVIPESIPQFSNGFYIYLIQDPRDIFHEITYGKTNDMSDRTKQYRIQFKCINPIVHKTWKFNSQQEIDNIEKMLDMAFCKYRSPSSPEWLVNIDSLKAIKIVESVIAAYKIQDDS